jgi:hypothetical protein
MSQAGNPRTQEADAGVEGQLDPVKKKKGRGEVKEHDGGGESN